MSESPMYANEGYFQSMCCWCPCTYAYAEVAIWLQMLLAALSCISQTVDHIW